MNNGSGLSELFKKLTEKRNTIFLIMCLIVPGIRTNISINRININNKQHAV